VDARGRVYKIHWARRTYIYAIREFRALVHGWPYKYANVHGNVAEEDVRAGVAIRSSTLPLTAGLDGRCSPKWRHVGLWSAHIAG
jgi:hypothetical protein